LAKRELLSVALKVYGVVLLARAAAQVPTSVELIGVYAGSSYAGTDNRAVMEWTWGLMPVLGLGIGAVLLWKAGDIARFLSRSDTAAPSAEAAPHARCLLLLAIKVAGVALVALALPVIAESVTRAYQDASTFGDYSTSFVFALLLRKWAAPTTALVSIAVGVYLIAGTRGLVKLIYKEPQAEAGPLVEGQ
jgi:hypothetical protein